MRPVLMHDNVKSHCHPRFPLFYIFRAVPKMKANFYREKGLSVNLYETFLCKHDRKRVITQNQIFGASHPPPLPLHEVSLKGKPNISIFVLLIALSSERAALLIIQTSVHTTSSTYLRHRAPFPLTPSIPHKESVLLCFNGFVKGIFRAFINMNNKIKG